MVSLRGRFERDLLFLEHGQVPTEVSGKLIKNLQYDCTSALDRLSDDDVQRLSSALCSNDAFQGTLTLAGNNLTDLSALYLSRVFAKPFSNLTKLDLSDNPSFTTKAGEYIGGSLSSNPAYTISKVSFGKICLESIGLVRMVEAANLNKNIIELDVGIVTDKGLTHLADLLKENTSLEQIQIEETKDHLQYWSDSGRLAFTRMLKSFTQLTKVKIVTVLEGADTQSFLEEIKFYTKNKEAEHEKETQY